MHSPGTEQLKRVLKPVHLWAIAVGLVISGEYFGWNYGWKDAGTVGFLITTGVVTVMYITFIFSFTELTAAIPNAGGAFTYAYRALGPLGGLVAGYATLVEFLIAIPAIALALGSYMHFLYPPLPVLQVAIAFNVVFVLLNISGIKESAMFSVFITLLAVAELLLFLGIIAPSFKMENYMANSTPVKWGGVVAALPFAVWFYLAIEGVAMVAEEVKDPKKNIPRGYISALATLVLLALGVMVLTGGITDWRTLSNLDYPLPEAIAIVLGRASGWTKVFASIGLFGLVASLHGIILASSRQVFAMAREGYLPKQLSVISHRFKTPHWAIVASGIVSIITLCTGKTNDIIILSVMGAVVMYIISMVSLFALRRKEPTLDRPFVSPFYPGFPVVALLIAAICMAGIMYYNFIISLIFFGGLIIVGLIFIAMGKHKESAGTVPVEEPFADIKSE
ncbi:ethanolamine permease [Mucilaginibacter limnophilus]|uniref:Ethanolamine permease n=1 Tax=Mucilaginibacter limnophilus TaxID=1932778 RepID=A0A3S2VMT9_9SPHI|nr:ethanolamine permease [Mucilaginibacter limnophilus]RVU01028.1 ethanolamine permease [Mucilaginibacter limnophilus]